MKKSDLPRQEDWAGLTDEQIRKIIRYLRWHVLFLDVKNLRTYDKMSIAGIVLDHQNGSKIYSINNKDYSTNTPTGRRLSRLHRRVEERASPVNLKWGPVKVATCAAIGVLAFGLYVVAEEDKARQAEERVENQVQEYAKTLPEHDVWSKTQQLIDHYRDSLMEARK